MADPIYKINFTVNRAVPSVTPTDAQSAGYYGDDNFALVTFTMDSVVTGHRYRIEIVDGNGAYDISELLDAKNKVVSYTIPRKWTAAGTATLHLVELEIGNDGAEKAVAHYPPVRLLFEARDESVPMGDPLPTWQAVMTRAENLTEAVHNAMLSGELDGPQGPQGEKGDKGDKGDPGSVSYETLTPEQKKELTAEGTALCAAVAAGVVTIEQNNNVPLKFWVGSQEEYDAIAEKEKNCFYIIDEDELFETLLADVVQLKTHLTTPTIAVETQEEAEQIMQNIYKALPSTTFARYCVNIGGSYRFYEMYKTVNGWGSMERLEYGNRHHRTVAGKAQGAAVITYTFLDWVQYADA